MTDHDDCKFPKLIHQTWETRDLPTVLEFWSKSWRTYHPHFEYRLWTDKDNLQLIKSVSPDFLDAYCSYNHFIKRVDAARYFYLYEYGGIYCDLDFECLKSFDNLLEKLSDKDVILGRMGIDNSFEHSLPNALMISKPKSPFWLHVINEMKQRVNESTPEFDTGPILLKDCYDSYARQSELAVMSQDVFYPINWATEKGSRLRNRVINEKKFLTDHDKRKLFPNAYAITYWMHTW